MKRFFSSLALLTLTALFLSPHTARAQDDSGDDQDISFQTFYDQLGNDGTWIQTDDYGYVFQPNESDPDWAPYTDGHWAYTEDGWTWVSDEPWGWATYHYGRWADIDGTGWVWVPGYQWAPAWVSWRYGNDYCGWAPLPPGPRYGHGRGHSYFGNNVDSAYHINANHYNFVRTNQLGSGNMRTAIMNRSGNASVFGRTKNITNIRVSGGKGFGGVSAGGPPISQVNAHSSRKIPTMRLTAARGPGNSTAQGNSLAVYAPKVNASTAHQGKPARVGRTLGSVGGSSAGSNVKPTVRHPAKGASSESDLTGEPSHTSRVKENHSAPKAPKPEVTDTDHFSTEEHHPASTSHSENKPPKQFHPEGGAPSHSHNAPKPPQHSGGPKPSGGKPGDDKKQGP